jgi:hypothetical protein
MTLRRLPKERDRIPEESILHMGNILLARLTHLPAEVPMRQTGYLDQPEEKSPPRSGASESQANYDRCEDDCAEKN